MMKIVKKIAIFLSLTLAAAVMLRNLTVTNTYAANLILTGNTDGLIITPLNENLFYIDDLLPGESAAAGLEIRNTDIYPFILSVEVVNIAEEEIDLLEVLNIKVFMNGIEIVSFPAKGGRYELGRFLPNQTSLLDVALTINGTETGNEYQMKGAELLWIFEASSEYEEMIIPGPGPGPGSDTTPDTTLYFPPPAVTLIGDTPVPLIDIDEIMQPQNESWESPQPDEVEKTPQDEDFTIIPDGEVPLVELEMPKTGEPVLLNYLLTGAIIAMLGIGMFFIKSKKQSGNK